MTLENKIMRRHNQMSKSNFSKELRVKEKMLPLLRENNVLLNFMKHYTASDIGYKRQGRSDGTSYNNPFSSCALRFNFPFSIVNKR